MTRDVLDKELRALAWWKLPENPRAIPLINLPLRFIKCRSDKRLEVTAYELPGYENARQKALLISPKGAEAVLPCLLLFHGGGFVFRAAGAHYRLAKEYAEKLPCRVLFVDYRLAPKHPFPTPSEDCFAAYCWVLENAEALGIDKSRVFLGGDSAGGNLAAAVTLMARDRGLPSPAGLLLIYPAVDRRMITGSIEEYKDGPLLGKTVLRMMWDAYLGDCVPEPVEYASPLEAASFDGFPPVYIEVAQHDPLRDEGVLLYERLKEENCSAQLHRVDRACHGFEAMDSSAITRSCMRRRLRWLQELCESD